METQFHAQLLVPLIVNVESAQRGKEKAQLSSQFQLPQL